MASNRALPAPPTTPPKFGNFAPVADNDVFATDEDTGFIITFQQLLTGDVDPNPKDILSVAGVSAVAGGSLTLLADGTGYFFQPDSNFHGTAGFSYTLSDGRGGTDTGAVTIQVASVNDSPVGGQDSFALDQGQEIYISKASLLANDTDVDGDAIGFAFVVDSPVHGSLVETTDGLGLIYTPDPDFAGDDAFTYSLMDSHGAVSDETTVTLAVAPVTPVLNETRVFTHFFYYLQDSERFGPIDDVADVRYPRDPYVYSSTANYPDAAYETRMIAEFDMSAVNGVMDEVKLHLDIMAVSSSTPDEPELVDIYIYGGDWSFGTQFWNVGTYIGTVSIPYEDYQTVDVSIDGALVEVVMGSAQYLGFNLRPHVPVLESEQGSWHFITYNPSTSLDVLWA